jgi:hypothetical protein
MTETTMTDEEIAEDFSDHYMDGTPGHEYFIPSTEVAHDIRPSRSRCRWLAARRRPPIAVASKRESGSHLSPAPSLLLRQVTEADR